MTNTSVVAKCTVADQSNPEGVELKNNKTWKSPAGGWLKVQSGKWVQVSTIGVKLTSDGGADVGLLQGMIFDTAKEGDSGVFRDDGNGGEGTWNVAATT